MDGGVDGVDGGGVHQLDDHHQHQDQRLARRKQVCPVPLSQALEEKVFLIVFSYSVYK